jgi:hypothetical protein
MIFWNDFLDEPLKDIWYINPAYNYYVLDEKEGKYANTRGDKNEI